MRLPNRDGEQIDPVPLFVVIATVFVVFYAWGPLYLMAFGVSVRTSLVIVTVLFVCLSVLAFDRLLWRARPREQRPQTAEHTFQMLVYGVLICTGILVLLSLPFLFGR